MLGLRVEVHGMETLNNAVRRRFCDGRFDGPTGKSNRQGRDIRVATSCAVLRAPVVPEAPRSGEWFRSVLGLFGRVRQLRRLEAIRSLNA